MFSLLMFFLGSIMGSFLNLCIYRLPKGESVIFPSSYCESCGQKIKPWHLIPILSWLYLKGRCSNCGAPIGLKHLLLEILTGILFTSLFRYQGLVFQLFPTLILTSILIVVAFIDLEHFLIPNKVILTGFLLGMGFQVFCPFISWTQALLGTILGGGILYFLALISGGAMGGGDVKLAALLGFYLGWQQVLLTLFLASLLATVIWLFLMLVKVKGKKDPIPFGTFLSLGALLTMFYGNQILTWYATYWDLI